MDCTSKAMNCIGLVENFEVALDALLDLLLARGDLGRREVAVAAVDRLELAAVARDRGLREQLQVAAQLDEASANAADAAADVTPANPLPRPDLVKRAI